MKRLCRDAGIDKVEAGPKGAVLSFRDNKFARPEKLIAFIGRRQSIISVRPDQKLVYRQTWESAGSRVSGVHKLMQEIAALAA
jgi:transcription-repair coupling factor (superfamily II helicase)